jgi:hypothetical protein
MATLTRFIGIVTAALVIIWSSSVSAGIVAINFPGDLADPCVSGCSHQALIRWSLLCPDQPLCPDHQPSDSLVSVS